MGTVFTVSRDAPVGFLGLSVSHADVGVRLTNSTSSGRRSDRNGTCHDALFGWDPQVTAGDGQ